MENKEILNEINKNKNITNKILPIMYSYKERRDALFNEDNERIQKEKLRKIKEDSINNITKLKVQAIENLTKNGVKVFEAKNTESVKKIIKEIIGDAQIIVKSKSNTFNEVNLKEFLKNKEVIETDLGDFICDLCGEDEIHPVLPSFHLSPEKISECINKKLKLNLKPNPEEILKYVRKYVRNKIMDAKVGITGANVISADGSVIILENEGNISLVSRFPEKHIIIAGFEKIVPNREDALHVVKCAANYGTGQPYPMYVNIISGPSKTADIQNKILTGAQGAKELYLILIDNGRSEILNSEFKELLYCINCGACLDFCPVFHQLLKKYGSNYFSGAKGVISSYFSEGKKSSFENGAFYCTGCKMCKENCPAMIDLSDLIKKLREKLIKEGIEPEEVKLMINKVKEYGNPFGKIDEGKQLDKFYCC
ncbi:MAG TPA: LUD domain-containing protein [Candidatus Paceibacterota bacterium]|nr:LUD domain-containing protein [Candidatus Paceibacterota bacterium]